MSNESLWEATAGFIKACAAIALVITACALLVIGIFAVVDTTLDVIRSID